MQATDLLVEEHRVIERALDSLEAGANRLASGQPVPAEFFLSAVEFMRGFADGCHHQKEEGVLFEYMKVNGITEQGCPLGVMLAEHAAGRQYTRALLSAAQGIQKGDSGATQRAIQSSRSYVNLLRQHIYKEDTFLFSIADQVIPREQHPQVWADFERADSEEGAHEKFLALVEQFKREIIA